MDNSHEPSFDADNLGNVPLTVSTDNIPECSPRERIGWLSIGFTLNAYFAINNFIPLLAQSCALVASGFPGVCQNIITNPARIADVFPARAGHPNVTSMFYVAGFPGLECDDPSFPECIGDYCRGVPSSTSDCRLEDGSTLQHLRAGPGVVCMCGRVWGCMCRTGVLPLCA